MFDHVSNQQNESKRNEIKFHTNQTEQILKFDNIKC